MRAVELVSSLRAAGRLATRTAYNRHGCLGTQATAGPHHVLLLQCTSGRRSRSHPRMRSRRAIALRLAVRVAVSARRAERLRFHGSSELATWLPSVAAWSRVRVFAWLISSWTAGWHTVQHAVCTDDAFVVYVFCCSSRTVCRDFVGISAIPIAAAVIVAGVGEPSAFETRAGPISMCRKRSFATYGHAQCPCDPATLPPRSAWRPSPRAA